LPPTSTPKPLANRTMPPPWLLFALSGAVAFARPPALGREACARPEAAVACTALTVSGQALAEDFDSGAALGLVQKALRYGAAGRGALRTGDAAPPPAGGATSRPLAIYVYDLPSETVVDGKTVVYRDTCHWTPDWKPDRCWERTTPGSEEEMSRIFGPLVEWSAADGNRSKLKVRGINQFATGSIFLASLQRHPRRTANPEEADLFFVPAYNDNPHPLQSECASAEQLVKDLPHLNNQTADRHFWLTPNIGWGNNTCHEFNAKLDDSSLAMQLLARTKKLALEDRISAPMSLRSDAAFIDFAIGDEYLPPVAENLHSIPYPTVLSGMDAIDVQAWQDAVVASTRTMLASGMWGMHGLASTIEMRRVLTKQCQHSSRCSFKDLAYDPETGNTEAVMQEMLQSTFCLQPTGDSISRKGLVDSIVAGCIPVLFNPLQAKLWPWHIGPWEDVAVVMEVVPGDVMGALAQVPAQELARLRGNMARLLERLVYSPPGAPRPNDAMDVTLRGLLGLLDER